MTVVLPRISWLEAEPGRADAERAAMSKVAPDLKWTEDVSWFGREGLVGWKGLAPAWASDRSKPPGVDELLDGRRLELMVIYGEAFPMVAPAVVPIDPDVPIHRRTAQAWHVNGDGSLCVMQSAADWQPHETAAELVTKASGWFIEYQLMERELIERMSIAGLHASDEHDEVIATFAGTT